MATFNKFDCFVEDVAEGKHNLGSDVLKVMLTDVAPVATNTVYSNITQIANGNGYSTGGAQATITSSSQTSGLYKLILADPATWTATPAAMAQFRYAVLYNDTSATKPLIGWWDRAVETILQVGDTFVADMPVTEILSIQ